MWGSYCTCVALQNPLSKNAVRDLSRRVKGATLDHVHAMHRVINYCVTTKDKGWVLHPNRTWDGKDKLFAFMLDGKSDSDYAVCQETRRSVTGYIGYLEGSLVVARSVMQKRSALSTICTGQLCARYDLCEATSGIHGPYR